MREPTTAAMVAAAQDALDVAAGDEAVALAKYRVAKAAREYAEGVLRGVQLDHDELQPA